MIAPIRIAVIGLGKIARDQHLPAIGSDDSFTLVATASPHGNLVALVPHFPDHVSLISAMTGEVDAAAICTPATVRHEIARDCLRAGLHVLLEKPPAATLGQVAELAKVARQSASTVFTAWHAQHNPAVRDAAAILAGKKVASARIEWREDVRKWHPGQRWIWEAGGLGVFDAGINALSIVSRIMPAALLVEKAMLLSPANRQMPIAAKLTLGFPGGTLAVNLDWREPGGEVWDIAVETVCGRLVELRRGGAECWLDGERRAANGIGEYPAVYRRFAELVRGGASDIDAEPLRIVADAFMVGERRSVDAFDD